MAERERIKQAVGVALADWEDQSKRPSIINGLSGEFGTIESVAIRLGLGIRTITTADASVISREFLDQAFFGQTLLSTAIRRNPSDLATALKLFKAKWVTALLELMHQVPDLRVQGPPLATTTPKRALQADTSVSIFDESTALLSLTVMVSADEQLFKAIVSSVLEISENQAFQAQILSYASNNRELPALAKSTKTYGITGGWQMEKPTPDLLRVSQGNWPKRGSQSR